MCLSVVSAAFPCLLPSLGASRAVSGAMNYLRICHLLMLLTLAFTLTLILTLAHTHTLTALLVGVCRKISIRVIILISMHIYALPDGHCSMHDARCPMPDGRWMTLRHLGGLQTNLNVPRPNKAARQVAKSRRNKPE